MRAAAIAPDDTHGGILALIRGILHVYLDPRLNDAENGVGNEHAGNAASADIAECLLI